MPYNLRSRIRENLIAEDVESFGGNASDDEDHASEQSESQYSNNSSDSEADVENTSLNNRLLQLRQRATSRGRPASILKSKNNTKWKVGSRERLSG